MSKKKARREAGERNLMPDFALEIALRAHHGGDGVRVIGLDEAGRGPWAGPVVAGAAWLDPERCPAALRRGLQTCAGDRPTGAV